MYADDVMSTDEAIESFAQSGRELPIGAMLWCRDNWESAAPALVGVLERYAAGTHCSKAAADALFFILHLAGERGETRAFAPLCRLAHDRGALEEILGDGVTASLGSILIGTYDGNLDPLRALIEDPAADEMVRAQALDALGYLTASGRVERGATETYLRELYDRMLPQEESWVWFSWALLVALLRIDSLAALADQAFARGLVPEYILGDHADYRELREQAAADPEPLTSFEREQIGPIEDAIDELSQWAAFSGDDDDDDLADDADLEAWAAEPQEPAVNPHKNVGRNDPCPCGSGKKFKKCCLITQRP